MGLMYCDCNHYTIISLIIFSLQTAETWAPILSDVAAGPGGDREAVWCGLHPQMLCGKECRGQDREEELSQAGH